MEARDLKQKDLVHLFVSPRSASEAINGVREKHCLSRSPVF